MIGSNSPLEFGAHPFVDRLSASSKALANSVEVDYEPGQVIYQPGDPDLIEILASGFARTFLSSPDGRQTTVRYVHRGELMGGLLATGAIFEGSTQITVSSKALRLDARTVRKQVEIDGELAKAMTAELAIRYAHIIRTLSVHLFGTMLQRIAFDLLERACREQLAHGTLEVRASHDEIANGIGSVRQVVSRGLSDLREMGLVATGQRRIQILEPARLEELAVAAVQ